VLLRHASIDLRVDLLARRQACLQLGQQASGLAQRRLAGLARGERRLRARGLGALQREIVIRRAEVGDARVQLRQLLAQRQQVSEALLELRGAGSRRLQVGAGGHAARVVLAATVGETALQSIEACLQLHRARGGRTGLLVEGQQLGVALPIGGVGRVDRNATSAGEQDPEDSPRSRCRGG
jgi:hypothetical protein